MSHAGRHGDAISGFSQFRECALNSVPTSQRTHYISTLKGRYSYFTIERGTRAELLTQYCAGDKIEKN